MDGDPSPSPGGRSVDLVIRFTTSLPDLVLTISRPNTTSTLSLKQQIRPHLPSDISSSRLRLIAAGKVLPDTKAISECVSIPPAPPSDPRGKGKAPVRASPPPSTPNPRIYIHCSIGDALSPSDLEAESLAAATANDALSASSSSSSVPSANASSGPSTSAARQTQTETRPRGFDRLLASGFNADEVATLRTQFMAIQAHTHTPDTMPTGDALRALEDRWLDADAGSAGGAGAGMGGDSLGAEDGGLEDMLWGNIMGFFWPIAAVCWLMREEGVWPRRRQIAVLSGMLVNITFGFLRLTN